MGWLQQIFLSVSVLSVLLLLTGLFKPWLVLWWRSSQNRRQVMRLYGSLALLSLGGYFVVTILAK